MSIETLTFGGLLLCGIRDISLRKVLVLIGAIHGISQSPAEHLQNVIRAEQVCRSLVHLIKLEKQIKHICLRKRLILVGAIQCKITAYLQEMNGASTSHIKWRNIAAAF